MQNKLTYAGAGVDEPREQAALARMLPHLRATYKNRSGIGRPFLESGHFANVLDLGGDLGLAIATDGVGTKILLASEPKHYESIAIDCVANNVNDLLCIGAEPIALVDYIALSIADELLLESIAIGLGRGAALAGISIPGGEIAQVGEMLSGPSGKTPFDLVGTAVGVVSLSTKRHDLPALLNSDAVRPGDILIGLQSSGLHSNGYSLARKALFETGGCAPSSKPPELGGKTIVAELLEPTMVYVPHLLPLLRVGNLVKALANISGGGLLCLGRLSKHYSLEVDFVPPAPSIFRLIIDAGRLTDEEAYAAFNMGIGMALVCDPESVGQLLDHFTKTDISAWVLGKVIEDDAPGRIFLRKEGLIGEGDCFINGRGQGSPA